MGPGTNYRELSLDLRDRIEELLLMAQEAIDQHGEGTALAIKIRQWCLDALACIEDA